MKPYQQERKISTSLDQATWDRFCQIQRERQVSMSALARQVLTAWVLEQANQCNPF